MCGSKGFLLTTLEITWFAQLWIELDCMWQGGIAFVLCRFEKDWVGAVWLEMSGFDMSQNYSKTCVKEYFIPYTGSRLGPGTCV